QAAGLGHGLLARQPRRAEIGETGAAIGGKQDVLRLDVPMYDAQSVGRGERGGDLTSPTRRGVGIERATLAHPHGEVRTRDVLHHDKAPRAVVDHVVHTDDVGVAELPDGLHFATQPLAREARRRGWRHQELERDIGADATVAGAVYNGKPAAPDL